MTAPALSLVPLDDRPCNHLFPAQLAAVAGWQMHMPPREALGWFTRPGECERVAAWLLECPTQRIAVSLDMLCYGGLVASRAPDVSIAEARRRLDVLRRLKASRSEVAIFAFSTIMRLGKTVASQGDLELHGLLRAYSELVDRVERLGEDSARGELDSVVARLDPALLDGYLAVRRRNHAINRAAIQLVAEDVVDYLVVAQEDAAPVGIHVPEQLALRGHVEEFRLGERVRIHPGADEVGLVLLARHVGQASGRVPAIATDYAVESGADVVPRFESQPLRETVEGQIAAAGARPAAPGDADAIMFVHTPAMEQRDITEAPPVGQAPGLALQAESVVERVRAAAAADCTVGIADTAYCNGADPELIAALERTGAARRLAAFAGWNTAANSSGTVIAHLCLASCGRQDGTAVAQQGSAEFRASRFIDDYGYQSRVRQQAIARAQQLDADPHALGDEASALAEFVQGELEPLAHWTYSDLLAAEDARSLGEVRFSLPWHRLFEVEVNLGATGPSKNRR